MSYLVLSSGTVTLYFQCDDLSIRNRSAGIIEFLSADNLYCHALCMSHVHTLASCLKEFYVRVLTDFMLLVIVILDKYVLPMSLPQIHLFNVIILSRSANFNVN